MRSQQDRSPKSDGIRDLLPKCQLPEAFNMCSEPLGLSLRQRGTAPGFWGLGLRCRSCLHTPNFNTP